MEVTVQDRETAVTADMGPEATRDWGVQEGSPTSRTGWILG